MVELVPERGFGFIQGEDGEEYRFHRGALLGVDFAEIAVGTPVVFAVDRHAEGDEPGERPRAVSIRLADQAISEVENAPLPEEKTA